MSFNSVKFFQLNPKHLQSIMWTKCLFPRCSWIGPKQELLKHSFTRHEELVRVADPVTKAAVFTLSDLIQDTILLAVGNDDLYWYLLYPYASDECLQRGVFAVGDSTICTYLSMVGINTDSLNIRMGIYKTEPEGSQKYHLRFLNHDMPFIIDEIPSRLALLTFYDPDPIFR